MSRKQLMHLECENCKGTEVIDVTSPPSEVLPKIENWLYVNSADAPNDNRDHSRWYCRLDCLVTGETKVVKYRRELKKSEEEARAREEALTQEQVKINAGSKLPGSKKVQ
jgi:hypothetical protein